jgi:8-oxo-dGTP pyrophosphatase MutT (NUDIX family)
MLPSRLNPLPLIITMRGYCEATVSAIIEKYMDNLWHCLLVERFSPEDPAHSGTLGLPGGRINISDMSIPEALRREVREETGLIITGFRQNPRVTEYKRGGLVTHSIVPFCCEFFPGRYAGPVFICEAKGRPRKTGDGTRNPIYMPVPDLKIILTEEPERIFPYHVGTLMDYVREKEFEL